MPALPKDTTAETVLAMTRHRDHVVHGSAQGKNIRGCWNLQRQFHV
jgi:hypothetical protein